MLIYYYDPYMSERSNLGKRARTSLFWDLGGTFFRQLSTLAVSVILARLLEPAQFGVIGIALVFVAISGVFIDVGFTDGLVQRQNVSQRMYSSVFYVNLLISFLLATGIYFVAPLIGNFFENSKITDVVKWLILVLPISAMGKVHQAILTKKLQFRALALRDVIATLFGGLVGIGTAFLDFGVYALVGQQLTTAFVGMVALWLGTGWKPSVVFSFSEIRSLMSFSAFVFFDHIFRQIFQRIDTLFIGKVFSPTVLGFYSRAESLNAQVMDYTSNSLRKVIFPVLSSLQGDSARFHKIYFRVFNLAAVLSITLAGLLFFLGDRIILVLLGEKWAPSIVIFQILVFRSIFGPFSSLMGKSLLGMGYSRLRFQISFVQRLILLTPMLVGYFYGIEIFAAAVVGAFFIGFFINAAAIDYALSISFWKQLTEFFKPTIPLLVLTMFTIFAPFEVDSFLMAIIFLLIQIIYLILIQNEGIIILRNELNSILSR